MRHSALRRLGRGELTSARRSHADRYSSPPTGCDDGQWQTDRAAHPVTACEIEPSAAVPTVAAVDNNRVTHVSLAGVAPAYGGPTPKLLREDQLEIGAGACDEPPLSKQPGGWIMRTRRGALKRLAHPWAGWQGDHAENDGHPPPRALIVNRLATRKDANQGVTRSWLLTLDACAGRDRQGGGNRQSHR